MSIGERLKNESEIINKSSYTLLKVTLSSSAAVFRIILDSTVRNAKAIQGFESESCLIGGEHS